MRKTITQQRQLSRIDDEVKVHIYNFWTCGLSIRKIADSTGYDAAVIEQVLRETVILYEMEATIAACQAIKAEELELAGGEK